jgi:N-methylhydantoinase A/oxoprolinase/acetone carboxylase beta subunit
MTIRVGVDVGGTFTKAIAFDASGEGLVASAIVATTHDHPDGVAAGVVEVVHRVADKVGADKIELVTHSTTQAVNALLEGDVATVAMIGMGRAPDLRKARKRTVDAKITLDSDRGLATVPVFLDVTSGLTQEGAADAVARAVVAGAQAIAVAEAFSPDDHTNEELIAAAAHDAGVPVTTSTELTGLYGLELRAVTAALNASILPIALRTAEVVGAGVAAAGVAAPVMVMRGDAGATDLAGFRRAPARTLYSGPAASVAGALRTERIEDGVIVEVGGTSTNVAAIHRGRPALSYVRVASHATAIRALDVRVMGVAGGSMLRARRSKVYGVGPRSAHIAGLPYACFLEAADFTNARTALIAPRPGDPADYLVIRLADGRSAALTVTCAANALGLVHEDDYAAGSQRAALAAFEVAGASLRLEGEEVARRLLATATQAVGDLVASVIKDHKLANPVVVAVGGGAGALGRAVAAGMDLEIVVPEHAEIISAVGDALSLIRAERERAFDEITPAATAQLVNEVEAEAIAAGAAAATLDVKVEQVTERRAVRVTVTGAVGLSSGAVPGRQPATGEELATAAANLRLPAPEPVGRFWVSSAQSRVAVFDSYGDIALDLAGEVLTTLDLASVRDTVARHTRRSGPLTVSADAWVISGARLMQVPDADPQHVLDTAHLLGDSAVIVIGRD